MNKRMAQCNWPELPAPYDSALRSAVSFILDKYDVLGLIASGTIIRGTPDPTSDFDLYVIHRAPFRQRIQKFFETIPAEIFVNPPARVEKYFKEEQAERTPITAHMLATGFVILKVDEVVDRLQEQARRILQQPPAPPEDPTMSRYLSASLLEDATDLLERDPDTAQMIAYQAVAEMLEFCFIRAGRFIPRKKSLLDELAGLDEPTANLARDFYQASTTDEKLKLAGRIADRTIGARGFFEWESAPEEVPSP